MLEDDDDDNNFDEDSNDFDDVFRDSRESLFQSNKTCGGVFGSSMNAKNWKLLKDQATIDALEEDNPAYHSRMLLMRWRQSSANYAHVARSVGDVQSKRHRGEQGRGDEREAGGGREDAAGNHAPTAPISINTSSSSSICIGDLREHIKAMLMDAGKAPLLRAALLLPTETSTQTTPQPQPQPHVVPRPFDFDEPKASKGGGGRGEAFAAAAAAAAAGSGLGANVGSARLLLPAASLMDSYSALKIVRFTEPRIGLTIFKVGKGMG